jgi:hypothetical protein
MLYVGHFLMMMFLFLAIVMFSLANGAWLLRRIQKAHHFVWVSLGQPTVALSTGVRPRLALVNYIWSLRFRELNDSFLSLACWAAITAELLLVALFLLLVIGVDF